MQCSKEILLADSLPKEDIFALVLRQWATLG